MFRKTAGLTILSFSILALCIEVNGQVCGYSINTLYVNDVAGNAIKKVKIRVTRTTPHDDYNPHFEEASTTSWDDQRQAYVYRHGLCGSHRNLLMRVSAEGFDVLEHAIDLPLGWQGFALTLKRKGTKETADFKTLSCSEETTVCVRTINQ